MGKYSERKVKAIKSDIDDLDFQIFELECQMDELEEDSDEFEELEIDLEQLESQRGDLADELEQFDNPEFVEQYENQQRVIARFGGELPRTLKNLEWWKIPLYPQTA